MLIGKMRLLKQLVKFVKLIPFSFCFCNSREISKLYFFIIESLSLSAVRGESARKVLVMKEKRRTNWVADI